MENKIPVPQLKTTTNGNIYKLNDAYVINFSNFFNFDIVVPENYETDLASIPPIIRWFMDRASLGIVPPLLHDYVCYTKGRLIDMNNIEYQLTWFECHLLFLYAMNITGIPWWKSVLAFLAVLFGVKNWEKSLNKNI